MKVLLVGYYGKGNFGDDVLLAVTHSIVRQAWPSAEIVVQCDGSKHGYLSWLLKDESLTVLSPGHRNSFDLTVHGGGGVFFDFARGRHRDRLVNALIGFLGGKRFARVEGVVRTLLHRARFKSVVTIGWGLGVGTYTESSRKLKDHVPVLAGFSGLMVRDSASLENLKAMGFASSVQQGSDIAFLGEHWAPPLSSRMARTRKGCPRLGLVLRDWPGSGNAYLGRLRHLIPELSKAFDLTFFFLDANTDREAIEVADGFPANVWCPETMSLEGFSASLASQDVLITARAHGAICGAVVGVPSVLIELEPKLRAVHAMLPNSSILVSPSLDTHEVLASLSKLASIDATVIAGDVSRNSSLSSNAVDELILLAKGSSGV